MLYRIGECELDLAAHRFRRNGEAVPLEPQVFALIALLARHAGELVTKDRIIETVWRGRIVSEATIASRISAARAALGDDGRRQALLQTVRGVGFRLGAEVRQIPGPQGSYHTARAASQQVRIARSRDGTPIAFATTGSGPPLLRAGHFLTHLEHDRQSPIWRPLIERLSQGFTMARYDQRCTGLSGGTSDTLTLSALVEDMAAVADAAGLSRFPVFAASQGVPVSIAFAARHPGRVSAMVLYGGFAKGRRVRGTAEERDKADAILTIIREAWGRSEPGFATAFAATYMPGATQEQMADMVELQTLSATAETAVALRQAIDNFDVSDLLAQIRVPVLVIHARGDAVQPVAQSRVLAAGIKGAEFLVLDSHNHVPLPQDPAWAELVDASARFLEAHG